MGQDYAVLGGGVLGLTVALRLLQRGHQVTLFEREPLPGGLVAGFRLADDVWLERFYHHLFRSDRAIVRLIHEVGLAGELEWRQPVTATLRGGSLHELDSALSMLRFSPISLRARLRMGFVLGYLRLLPASTSLEGKTATAWLRRWMGEPAYESVWAPLLRAKFGAHADAVALPWFWARVHDRSRQLGYVRGGFQRFYSRLAERLTELGGVLRFASEVRRISKSDGALVVQFVSRKTPDKPEQESFARVVSTLPTRLTCRMADDLPADYRSRYEWGEALGAHCLILALDRPLSSAYWININDPGYPFMVVVEHTNYMSPSDYGGRHLVYLGNYRPMTDNLFRLEPQQVVSAFMPFLRGVNPDFSPGWIQQAWSFGAPFAQPIVTTEYPQHIPPFKTPVAGLFIANMYQVYPHDRGQNYSVALAEKLIGYLDVGSEQGAA